jgi:hypothetical protein
MTANINSKTGIAYGVLQGNSVPFLLDDIQSNGTDNKWEEYKKELDDRISDLLMELYKKWQDGQPFPEGEFEQEVVNRFRSLVKDYHHNPKRIVPDDFPADIIPIFTQGDVPDAESIREEFLDRGLNDIDDCSDSFDYDYEYETDHGPVKLTTGTLGGAILIWVLESPWVAEVRVCSPCVPNAGDLDSPHEGGMVCYCLPPDDMPEEWEGKAVLVKEYFGEENEKDCQD